MRAVSSESTVRTLSTMISRFQSFIPSTQDMREYPAHMRRCTHRAERATSTRHLWGFTISHNNFYSMVQRYSRDSVMFKMFNSKYKIVCLTCFKIVRRLFSLIAQLARVNTGCTSYDLKCWFHNLLYAFDDFLAGVHKSIDRLRDRSVRLLREKVQQTHMLCLRLRC